MFKLQIYMTKIKTKNREHQKKNEEIPEYKDPHIEHHYPSRTKHEIFQQYFQLAAHAKGASYIPMPTSYFVVITF